MTLLREEIAQYDENKAKQVANDILQTMAQATQYLKEKNIENKAIKTNDVAPEFNLMNHKNEPKSLKQYLEKSLVVLSFYRGGWCPYCNMELHALQELLADIEKAGAILLAVSPEVPDHSLSTHINNKLTFDILYDKGNEVAKKFGLVFQLPEVLKPIYANFGLDIQGHNGDDTFKLPMPATYIINQKGKVLYDFVDADYTKRSEPGEIIDILNTINS